jgi:hypothetical protein
VFRDAATLRTMLTVPATNDRPGGPYAMGIQRLTLGAQVCWGHHGFWGTAAKYCPDADVAVVRHISQAQPAAPFVVRALDDQVARVLDLHR